MNHQREILILVCAALSLASGCKDNRVIASERSARGGVDLPMAAEDMVTARCEREARCAARADRDTSERDARSRCLDEFRTSSMLADFGPPACSAGVKPTPLDACIRAVRDQACGAPLDAIVRLQACQISVLCPPAEAIGD